MMMFTGKQIELDQRRTITPPFLMGKVATCQNNFVNSVPTSLAQNITRRSRRPICGSRMSCSRSEMRWSITWSGAFRQVGVLGKRMMWDQETTPEYNTTIRNRPNGLVLGKDQSEVVSCRDSGNNWWETLTFKWILCELADKENLSSKNV